MRKLVFATAAMLAAVLVVGAAGAEAKIVDLNYPPNHFSLAPGDSFTALQEEFGGTAVDFATSAGTVECRNESNHNALLGEVVSNDQHSDAITFTDGGFEFGEPCKFGEGVAFAAPSGFPWDATLSSSGKVMIVGTPAVAATLELPGGASCEFASKKLKATTAPVFGQSVPLELALSGQKLKLDAAGSTGMCPKTATMSATFKTVSSHGPVDILVFNG